MSAPETEAGRRLETWAAGAPVPLRDLGFASPREAIAAIEAEAIAQERARIDKAVHRLDNIDTDPKYDTVSRASVLAIVNGDPS